MRILGFMTGTSLDAVDMAVVETDGETIAALGSAGERKLSAGTRDLLLRATAEALRWRWDATRPAIFAAADRAVADEHLAAARGFLAGHGLTAADLDLVGFHGQTVLHQPPGPARRVGRTVQLGDAAWLAAGLGVPVAHDFRSADVAAGGQGAPLASVYHQALAAWSGLEPPVGVLNLGGVGNLTLIRLDGTIEAFDTGPANGMIDLFMQARTDLRYDPVGRHAAAGRIDEAVLAAYLAHPYFSVSGPKSLDRFDFSLDRVAALSLEDGAATLTAFAAEAVARGLARLSEAPRRLIVTGGGRRNPVLMAQIRPRAGMPVQSAEDVGWRGDSIEAEAFAYLAARTGRGLPITFPGTTGAPAPLTGGRIAQPAARLDQVRAQIGRLGGPSVIHDLRTDRERDG
jgi:anhydro-N-acetylmuramic acid kinase